MGVKTASKPLLIRLPGILVYIMKIIILSNRKVCNINDLPLQFS